MCGHMGHVFLDGPNIKAIGTHAVMAIGMDKRGGHSWGYWADGDIVKGLGEIHQSVPAERWAGYKRLIGHTRNATMGAKTIENSHPFEKGNIIGAHNGVVYNHDELNKKYGRKFEVDSEHIFAHINENKPLSEIEAYGAIVYLNKQTDIIHLGRFNGGSLYAANLYDSNHKKAKPIGFAWCSTNECLKAALDVAGWEYWNGFELKDGHTYWVNEQDRVLNYSNTEDLDFSTYIKVTTVHQNTYKSPKSTGQGVSAIGTDLNAAELKLLRRFDMTHFKSTCSNCREIEKTIKHDKFNIELCYTCWCEMDEVLNTLDDQIYADAFKDKQETVVPLAEQGYMPV